MPETVALDSLFELVKSRPRDLNEHADYIRHVAEQSPRITAFVKRREWDVLLAAGRPLSLTVYQSENDPLLIDVKRAVETDAQGTSYTSRIGALDASILIDIDPTDLLVIDTVHHADRLWVELTKHAPKASHRVLLRGTGAFGEVAEGVAGPGLLVAVRRWISEHPEWFAVYHTTKQYGLTLLSRIPEEKPAVSPLPPVPPPPKGPGTELKKLLASLGVNPAPSCDCNAKSQAMDMMGVEGCKRERDFIAEDLRKNAPRWKWSDKIKAAALAVTTGVAFKLDLTDPYGSLVDLAIQRAEEAEREEK